MFAHANNTLILGPVLVGVLLAATGCTSTHRVVGPSGGQGESPSDAYGYSRVTAEVADETVQVFLRSGQEMKLKNLYVGPDSTTGTLPQGGEKTFPTSALQKIQRVDRGTGFLQGAGIGIAIPLASGALASTAEGNELIPAWVVGAALSIPGGLVGGLIGAGSGQREVYRFPRSPRGTRTTAPSERRTETVRRPEE